MVPQYELHGRLENQKQHGSGQRQKRRVDGKQEPEQRDSDADMQVPLGVRLEQT